MHGAFLGETVILTNVKADCTALSQLTCAVSGGRTRPSVQSCGRTYSAGFEDCGLGSSIASFNVL